MKPKLDRFARSPTGARGFRRPAAVLLTGLVMTLFTLSQFPLSAGLPRQVTFNTNPQWMRVGSSGTMMMTNGQALLKLWRSWPTAPNQVADSLVGYVPYWGEGNQKNWVVRFLPDRTVELRMDVIQLKQDDAFAVLGAGAAAESDPEKSNASSGAAFGYAVLVDRNEIALVKFGSPTGDSSTAYFFWDKVSNLPDNNLTLSVTFTPMNANLAIKVRVLDTLPQTVLWEKSVVDTVGRDAVLPNRAVKNLLMQPEGIAAPFTGMDLFPAVGLLWCNTTSAPVGPVEVTIDNVQLLDYHAPHLEIARSSTSVALSWLTPLEDHIVVGAPQLSGPWCPCPHPPTLSGDMRCMTMPCPSAQMFFKLVPGTQLTDAFNGIQPPWVPRFWNSADASRFAISRAKGALRVRSTTLPADGRIVVLPPGPEIQVADFWASVDIINWDSDMNPRSVGLWARGVVDQDNFPGQSSGYVGELWINRANCGGKASLNIKAGPHGPWNSDQPVAEVPKFNLEPDTEYRLVFSGVDYQLTLRLFKLSDLQHPLAECLRPANLWSEGPVGLWFANYGKGPYDFSLDNFFVSGTRH